MNHIDEFEDVLDLAKQGVALAAKELPEVPLTVSERRMHAKYTEMATLVEHSPTLLSQYEDQVETVGHIVQQTRTKIIQMLSALQQEGKISEQKYKELKARLRSVENETALRRIA